MKIKRFFQITLITTIIMIVSFLSINYYVVNVGKSHLTDFDHIENADCIIVLGAAVRGDTVSYTLQKRLNTAASLYLSGKAPKIIVSGDHGRKEYNEVSAMRKYLVNKGIPVEDIFMDHAGFDTYDTIYRARDVFLVQNPIIVSQESHAIRSAYIADRLDMSCYCYAAEGYSLAESKFQIIRESLARVKAFLQCEILHSKPKYLGDTIPVSGSGLLTED